MKINTNDKSRRGRSPMKILVITMVLLSMLVSTASANIITTTEKENAFKTYTSSTASSITLHIINKVGSKILVAWTKVNTRKSIFKVSIPNGKTVTVKVSPGTYDQYVQVGSAWYRVAGHAKLVSGYIYSSTYYWGSKGSGLTRIPNSQAPI